MLNFGAAPGCVSIPAFPNRKFRHAYIFVNARAGIETPRWIEAATQGLSMPDFAGPYIVKSVWEHASIGIDDSSVVEDPRKLAAVARRRQRR